MGGGFWRVRGDRQQETRFPVHKKHNHRTRSSEADGPGGGRRFFSCAKKETGEKNQVNPGEDRGPNMGRFQKKVPVHRQWSRWD